jgi:hypothetical protein
MMVREMAEMVKMAQGHGALHSLQNGSSCMSMMTVVTIESDKILVVMWE